MLGVILYSFPDFGSTFSGVLTDEHGRVQAIWGSFSTQVLNFNLIPMI